jgi:DNA-binding transcriptional ArsR family regulator
MNVSPGIAPIAALIGDPTRSIMLVALMDGRALTVSELAQTASITVQTASEHLSRLDDAGLVTAEKQGRHRYYRLAGTDVADLIEGLMGVAQRCNAKRVVTGPRNVALREARICYDHLAGVRGVALLDAMRASGYVDGGPDIMLSDVGAAFLTDFGIDIATLSRGRRPMCRTCLDWSERRNHLGGALGAALLQRFLALRWVRHFEGRALAMTPTGVRGLAQSFGIE